MTKGKESKQNPIMWWEQFNLGEEMEKQSLQFFESQKEWAEGTREQINQFEEDSKRLTTDWKTNTQTFLTENYKEFATAESEEWLNKLEDLSHKSQQMALLPGKTSLDMFTKSTRQLEENFVKVAEQNKKVREEATKTMESAFEQMKQAQAKMFSFFPFNPIASK